MRVSKAFYVLVVLTAGLPVGAAGQNIVANPPGNQTIVQPGTLAQNNATTLSVNRFENIRYADQFLTLQRAIDDTPAGGTLVVPPGYSTTLPDSDNKCVNISRSIVVSFAGSATINQGSCQIIVQPGASAVSIVSDFIGFVNGGSNPGNPVRFFYTGAGSAIQVGGGSADTINFHLKGIYVDLSNAHGSAVGITLSRVQQFILDSFQVGAGTNSATKITGILLNGTGDSTHNFFTGIGEINSPVISMGANSNCSIGIQAINQVTATLVRGGEIQLPSAPTPTQCPLGTRCFDVDGTSGPSSELLFYSPNCEAAVTGLSVEGIGSRAVGDVRVDSGVSGNTLANFNTPNTGGSKIRFVNATGGAVVDSGFNSVEFPYLDEVRNDLWQIQANQNGWGVTYVPKHTGRILLTGNTFINAGSGSVKFNTGSGNGVQFYDGNNNQVAAIDNAGNAQFNGSLTAGGVKAFKIDHPLDPANKYLLHSAVESSDMKDMYDGIVALDEKGEASVRLPEWFQALNKDFRYQLTCIGASAPVYVAQEIRDNAFRIAGGRPSLKVSWQVTGIRHDAAAEASRFGVEEQKPTQERGHYLFPGFEKTIHEPSGKTTNN